MSGLRDDVAVRDNATRYDIGTVEDSAGLAVLQSAAHRRQVAKLSDANRPSVPLPAGAEQGCHDLQNRLYQGHGKRSARAIDTRSADIERLTVTSLNRSSVSPQSLHSLEESLAALSIRDPFTVFSCVCDAAVRLQEGSDYRRSLRRVLKSLEHCAFVPCRPATGVELRASSAWLFTELTSSGPREDYVIVLLRFLTKDVLSVHLDELSPPFDVEGCLITVVPVVMGIYGRKRQGIRLAKICVTSMVERSVRPPANIARAFAALQAVLTYEARAMLSRDDLEAAVCTLEVMCEWCRSGTIADRIWEEIVACGSCSWHVSVTLWSHGYGPANYFEKCRTRALAVLPRNAQHPPHSPVAFHADDLVRLEIAIIATASRLDTMDMMNGDVDVMARERRERATIIDRFIEEQLESIARLAAYRRPVWILALARQFSLLSASEHRRLTKMLYPHATEMWCGVRTASRQRAAMEAFMMEMDVVRFLTRVSNEAAGCMEGLRVDVAIYDVLSHISRSVRLFISPPQSHAEEDDDDAHVDGHSAVERCYIVLDGVLRAGLSGLSACADGDARRDAMRASLVAEAMGLVGFLRASGDDAVMARVDALLDGLARDGQISDAERSGLIRHALQPSEDEKD